MSQVGLEVKAVVKEILNSDSIEEAFTGFLLQTQENQKLKKECCLEIMRTFWGTVPVDSQPSVLKEYVTAIHMQSNSKRSKLLFDTLESLVENNIVSAKLICEALVNCEELDYKATDTWCQTFHLVRKIIGGVDYKGCRDVLRFMLEKVQSIPGIENVYMVHVVDAIVEVIAYAIDRNTCLMPSYFAVNEISKLSSDGKNWPHWKLGQLLSDFVQSFRPTAQMVSISGRSDLLPVVGHSCSTSNVWKLNPVTLRFTINGPLPFDKELMEPQTAILRYVLEQPYSRDMVSNMLGLNKQVKQRCTVLEDQLVDLVVLAMEISETEEKSEEDVVCQLLWQHLSSQLIFFVLFQFASFPHMVLTLYNKLKGKNLRKGRDHLMWVLLQFISGSIQKNPLNDFLPVMKLYDLLYPEHTTIPVPDETKAVSTHIMAVTCIWIHLKKKAQNDKVKLQRPIPHVLQSHIEYLRECLQNKNLPMTDYRIALLCNAYSTNQDYFSLPMGVLIESVYGNGQSTTSLPGNISASAPIHPLSMNLLDSLTVHAKMSLIHSIVTKVIKLGQMQSNVALSPALVETYSRLLVYMEIESLGIKGFISQVLPNVFRSNAWGILHTLLEMFSYRLHHIQAHYRVQLLSHLYSLFSCPPTNQNQLHLCIENTALRLIMGLGSSEVQPQLSRMFGEPKNTPLLANSSEELSRALVLTLARAMHVTGSETLSGQWCKDILHTIMHHTPHSWSSHTLACFPQALADFFKANPIPKDDKTVLRRNVEAEYRKWKSMASENDLVAHFSREGSSTLFLCVLWKSLLEDSRIGPTAYKVLERLGPRAMSAHLRTFTDYLVYEFSSSGGGTHVNKCVEALNDLIWKCNVVSIDRLILCLSLRDLEGSEAHVCFFIIQLLLLKPNDFRNRVKEFVKENSPEHWQQNNWHEKHMAFHRKYPEKFYYEGLLDMNPQQPHQYLPIYFGNVCLRFIPVFDIVIHRFLEHPPVAKTLETLLEHVGALYKFHDRPMTYLFNTLHYYEKKLRDKPALKRKLVHAIIGSLKDIRPKNWCLTQEFADYTATTAEDPGWLPEQDYYLELIRRLVDTIDGKSPFPNCDWRFNEFPNPAAHALHATCIELVALPVQCDAVTSALLDIVLKSSDKQIPRDRIVSWMNAIGLVLTSLPECYWQVLNETVIGAFKTLDFFVEGDVNPFQMFQFSATHKVIGETASSYVLALCHAVWQHASIGQLSVLPGFVKEQLRPIIKNETQLLFLCHLVGPFLQRFHSERTRSLIESWSVSMTPELQKLTIELYEILEQVDKSSDHLSYMDPITDFLYHIKYMFVGDGVKGDVEKVIRNLRPALQLRLRFISHHGKEETPTT